MTTSWEEVEQYNSIINVSQNDEYFIKNIELLETDKYLTNQYTWLEKQQWNTKLAYILNNL